MGKSRTLLSSEELSSIVMALSFVDPSILAFDWRLLVWRRPAAGLHSSMVLWANDDLFLLFFCVDFGVPINIRYC